MIGFPLCDTLGEFFMNNGFVTYVDFISINYYIICNDYMMVTTAAFS